jgi:hypothetical protein
MHLRDTKVLARGRSRAAIHSSAGLPRCSAPLSYRTHAQAFLVSKSANTMVAEDGFEARPSGHQPAALHISLDASKRADTPVATDNWWYCETARYRSTVCRLDTWRSMTGQVNYCCPNPMCETDPCLGVGFSRWARAGRTTASLR